MEKWRQVKRNHHYVWAHYLSAWATGGNIYYISKKGKVAFDSIKGLCKDHEFYAVHKLSDEDISFVQHWIDKASDFLKEQHKKELDDFILFSRILEKMESVPQTRETAELKDLILCNSLENKYTAIENEFYPVIEAIKSEGLSTLSDSKNMVSFCSYVGHQFARTKSFRDRSIEAIRSNPEITNEFYRYVELAEKNWWLLSYFFGTNIGANLYFSRKDDHHVLINNRSSKPFLTGFHPLANVHECVAHAGVSNPPECLDLYFPLSPNLAYMFNQSANYNHFRDSIDEKEVDFLNEAVYENSRGRVIGSTAEVVEDMRSRKFTI